MGPGTLMAKIDIKSAFQLLPVHPADRHLLAMEWKGSIFFDNCLPFGLRSAPKLFNVLAELLEWIAEQNGVTFSIHYLDDFLTMGPRDTPICGHNLKVFTQLCHQLGVPLALEKVEGPATCLTFLGISIDSRSMLTSLPNEKLERIRNEISVWISRKTATKKQILSLVGLLQHATKVVRPSKTFVARMYSTAAKLKKLTFFTRLTKEFKSDLCWSHTFLHSWNGLSLLDHVSATKPPDYCIQTDASGAWGCGGIFKQHWFQLSWSTEWSATGIMAKELVPIVISCAIWGPLLAGHRVLCQCDNQSLVISINKGYSRDPLVMHLLRYLWFFVAVYDSRTYRWGIELCSRHVIKKLFNQVFLVIPPGLPSTVCNPTTTQGNYVTTRAGLDLPHLQVALQEYFANGAARSTWRTYAVGQRRYLSFCAAARRQAVPTTETSLMLFATHLATSGLAYTSIKVYLAAVRHLHVTKGKHSQFTA